MTDIERPKGSTNHPRIPLSDENIAATEALGANPVTTLGDARVSTGSAPVSEAFERMPRMSPAAAEEYVASLYATVLKRDPGPDEFAHWVTTAAALPPEQVYFAFVKWKEYKLQQEKSVRTMFSPGSYEFIRGLRPNLAVSDGDTMYKAAAARHYEFVGRSDLSVVLNALNLRATYPGGNAAISDVFDFGCGHGRVARWFRAAFPEAAIWVTDRDQAGVDWCVRQFGCKDTGGEIPADRFDVVWLGSVFTHLPRQVAEGLMDNLLKSLKPNGLLIFTTHGRFAVRMLEKSLEASDVPGWMHYNLERDSVEDLIRQFNEGGYGFVDYPRQTDYGVCVAKSHWYSDRILQHDSYIQILMQEKGCDNHQDVLAFMRADLGDRRKGPLF